MSAEEPTSLDHALNRVHTMSTDAVGTRINTLLISVLIELLIKEGALDRQSACDFLKATLDQAYDPTPTQALKRSLGLLVRRLEDKTPAAPLLSDFLQSRKSESDPST